jgi:hypothetical protein
MVDKRNSGIITWRSVVRIHPPRLERRQILGVSLVFLFIVIGKCGSTRKNSRIELISRLLEFAIVAGAHCNAIRIEIFEQSLDILPAGGEQIANLAKGNLTL